MQLKNIQLKMPIINPRLMGGGLYFVIFFSIFCPSLIFLRYLPKLLTDNQQIFSIHQNINWAQPDKRKTR